MGHLKLKLTKISLVTFVLISIFTMFSSNGYCYLRGDINNDNKIGLNEAIYALQVASGGRPAAAFSVINVPGNFSSIQEAVDAASPGDTINVAAGTYVGTIFISGKSLKLQGAGKDSSIIDGNGNDIITIDGGQLIVVTGFSLKNGSIGVNGKRGSSFELNNITMDGISQDGIRVDQNSTARLSNCSILKSGRYGIYVFRNSSAFFSGNISSNNNTDVGIYIAGTSSAQFYQATVEALGNGAEGIKISRSSSLLSGDSTQITVQNNKKDGINVWGGSGLTLGSSGNTLVAESNGDDGLSIAGASAAAIQSNNSLTFRSNKARGIYITENAAFESYGTTLLEANGTAGMMVNLSSSVYLAASNLQILNNIGYGLLIARTSTVYVNDGAEISVNGTSGGDGIGIYIGENSTLFLRGQLTVENTSGYYGNGINMSRNSVMRFTNPASIVQIRNNTGVGVYIFSNSHFESTFKADVSIHNNTKNGISVAVDSQLRAAGIKVQDNGSWGISADEGSNVYLADSTINGNSADAWDIVLWFGSRISLYRNTIGKLPIYCETSVISRGDVKCP